MIKQPRLETAGQRVTADASRNTFRGFVIVSAADLDDGCQHIDKLIANICRAQVPAAIAESVQSETLTCGTVLQLVFGAGVWMFVVQQAQARCQALWMWNAV